MTPQNITGDQNMKQNGFVYAVYGENQLAGLTDTTWCQKNLTHPNHNVRWLYRFDSKTPEFQDFRASKALKPLQDEETKETHVPSSTQQKHAIVIRGK